MVTCVADPNAVARIVFADDGVRGFRYVETSTA
jgi:hypothetical protein